MTLEKLLGVTTTSAILMSTLILSGCSGCSARADWIMFRASSLRNGNQLFENILNDPTKAASLHHVWTFTPPDAPALSGFRASPVVFNGKVYIGNGNGFFYCVDAATGQQVWRFPPVGAALYTRPLDQQFHVNPSSLGIASSAAIATIGNTSAVIFAAPDPNYANPRTNTQLGDGHLFALNADNGALIWESDVVANLTGTTGGSFSELHEQTGYSAPLVYGDKIYVGIADHGDNPIQNGKVVAVNLADGHIAFRFSATSTRGGGVWGSVAGWNDIYVTTGNTSECGDCIPPPTVNHGLSMLRLNKDDGHIVWKHQPVPLSMDNDPDWAAGPTVVAASCGNIVVSTQKDGWTWAVQSGDGTPGRAGVVWSFPPGPWTNACAGDPSAPSPGCFQSGDGTSGHHGDTHYKRPGAAWGDVFIGRMGGLGTITNLQGGYTRLTALNVCQDAPRVRWISDIPGTDRSLEAAFRYSLGPPSVTGGVVFVGTNLGHLVVVADPSVHPAMGNRCEDPDISSADCTRAGRRLVPDPWTQDIPLPNAPDDFVFGEPVIANGQVFVATDSGHLYMLKP